MADESKYPTRIAPYGLRMPPDLKARVQAAADANGRSLHGELLYTLEHQYPARPTLEELGDLVRLTLKQIQNAEDGPDRDYMITLLHDTIAMLSEDYAENAKQPSDSDFAEGYGDS